MSVCVWVCECVSVHALMLCLIGHVHGLTAHLCWLVYGVDEGKRGLDACVCACTNAKALSESNERVGECVWETERGTRSCKVKSLPVHVTSWWRERSPPSFFSLGLSFWTSSQEMLPLSPLSQSPTAIDYPCPVPKQAGKKSAICTTAVF